jgi:leucyl aminopeptidase (aminopeptidase T)
MQQNILDVLDRGEKVHVLGCGGNETDITVYLQPISDPEKETKFENCVADVNIPVGEVFTSPQLEGTEGVLFVSHVYLGDYEFKDLKLTFKEGRVTDYSCANFEDPAEGRKLIFDNILYKHDSLPIGEFAIGTNTVAYQVGCKYDILGKFPILIAEKTGPHFAVGDTCYSYSEDVPMYNPNGKEIIPRDNSISRLRDTDFSKAYFNCHTDITIPFEELGLIEVICEDGERIPIIKDGRFVVPGCEELNKPLEELAS